MVEVEGLDELRRAIRRAADKDIKDALKGANRRLAERIVSHAERRVPVRTGALRASLRSSGTVRDAIGRAGGARAPYAPVVHWRRGGVPFLRQAAEDIEHEAIDSYERAIDEVVRKITAD